ncbi:MAG: hypothetical protein ACR2NP_00280 [Pirellulaceae bacterium]
MPRSNFDVDRIAEGFPPVEERVESWSVLPDRIYSIKHRGADSPQIRMFADRQTSRRLFNPDAILMPTWCVVRMQPYELLVDDNSIEFHEFSDVPSGEFDVDAKRLYYRPRSFGLDYVFEAVFDARTGVCLASKEFRRVDRGNGSVAYIEKSFQPEFGNTPELDALSPLRRVAVADATENHELLVLELDRAAVVDETAFGPEAFGVSPADVEEAKERAKPIDFGGTTNVLVVIATVLISLFLLVICMCVFLAVLMKLSKPKTQIASEPAQAEVPDDLSAN